MHRSGESVTRFMDAVAPGLLLAQAIGRWGNWWNQELFGKPTDRPWGLEIDPINRPAQYLDSADLPPDVPLRVALEPARRRACCCSLDRLVRIRPPALFALYVAWYTAGRF